MTNTQASVAHWKAFYNTIYNSVLVAEVCKEHAQEVKFFEQISDCLCDSIFIISHCINRTMDFEESTTQNRIIVKFGISEELDTFKERYATLPAVMNQVAQEELQQLPEFVQNCSLVYIPEMGYLLAVPHWERNLTEEQLDCLPNLQYMFKTEDVAHYKTGRCCELDEVLGDVQLNVLELESKIVLKLVQYIEANVKPLIELTGLIAELDCLLSFTMTARDYGLVKPTLVAGKQISIIKGRHILKELQEEVFVPNDTQSSEGDSLIKILTGPNASGKSIYLKQVGLIVYLAHVGCFVPAEKATIGIIDQIHTRVQTVEPVNLHLSSFMMDLQQMSLALRNCTGSSLLLIDEFGNGTSEVDGLGILTACLQHFINLQDCPHLLVSTHFHSLHARLPETPRVRLQHLEHMVDRGELVYLFRLKDGRTPCSFALLVAETEELSKNGVYKAKKVLESLRSGGDITTYGIDKSSKLVEKRKHNHTHFIEAIVSEDYLKSFKNEVSSLIIIR